MHFTRSFLPAIAVTGLHTRIARNQHSEHRQVPSEATKPGIKHNPVHTTPSANVTPGMLFALEVRSDLKEEQSDTPQTRTLIPPSDEPTSPPLINAVSKKLEKKFPGILTSFPVELFSSAALNTIFQQQEQARASTSAPKASIIKEIFEKFRGNPMGMISATLAEHIIHRSTKVVVSEISANEFNATKVGHLGSVILPSAMVFGAEITIAPFHLLMTRVQTGQERGIVQSALSVVSKQGLQGLYKGAWAFALKGLMFTPGQITAWRVGEAITGKRITDMSLPEHAATVATGAVSGTIWAALPTKVFRDASVQGISAATVISKALQTGTLPYARTAFNFQVIAAKALGKAPAHVLQYTAIYGTVKAWMSSENGSHRQSM